MRDQIHKLLVAVLACSIFLIPSNWFIQLAPNTGYVHGLQVDYLLPKLYASVILSTTFAVGVTCTHLAGLFTFLQKLRRKKSVWLLVAVAGAVFLRHFFLPSPVYSFWFIAQVLVIAWFGAAVFIERKLLQHPMITATIVVTCLFQLLLGLYQYSSQHSLLGYLFLGEGNLSQSFSLARTSIGGAERVLAYGTTPHPNVLAGVVSVLLFCTVLLVQTKKLSLFTKNTLVVLCAVSAVGIAILTESLSGVALIATASGYLIWKKKVDALLHTHLPQMLLVLLSVCVLIPGALLLTTTIPELQIPETPSLTRRVLLNTAAMQLWQANPIWGVGLNQFTTQLEGVAGNEVVRFIQPAHHTGLLFLAELGISGIVLVGGLLWHADRLLKKSFALAIASILGPLLLDHYFYTLAQGQLVVTVMIATIAVSLESKIRTHRK